MYYEPHNHHWLYEIRQIRSRTHRKWLRILGTKGSNADVRPSETREIQKDGLRVLQLDARDLDGLRLGRQLRRRRNSKHGCRSGGVSWHGRFQQDGVFGGESWDDDVVRDGLDPEPGLHKCRVSVWLPRQGGRARVLGAGEE